MMPAALLPVYAPLMLPAVAHGVPTRNIVHCCDALDLLRALPDESVDAVITDPPYPGAIRSYGTMTERAWGKMMRALIIEMKRTLKPAGSAVLILQPNSERVGQMRPWLWDLMSWACRKWNIVQDAYWWNFTPFPTVHANRDVGLMRPSVKYCIWLGSPNCYRDQSAVLWRASDAMRGVDLSDRMLHKYPSGGTLRAGRTLEVVLERGGATPINLLPISNANSTSSGGAFGHGAATPKNLVDWWLRYITRLDDLVLDPFMGSGTVGLSARVMGRDFIGCDSDAGFVNIASQRLRGAYTPPLFAMPSAPVPAARPMPLPGMATSEA